MTTGRCHQACAYLRVMASSGKTGARAIGHSIAQLVGLSRTTSLRLGNAEPVAGSFTPIHAGSSGGVFHTSRRAHPLPLWAMPTKVDLNSLATLFDLPSPARVQRPAQVRWRRPSQSLRAPGGTHTLSTGTERGYVDAVPLSSPVWLLSPTVRFARAG